MRKEIQQLIRNEADAILNIPVAEHFEQALELIYNRVHLKGGKVIASGMVHRRFFFILPMLNTATWGYFSQMICCY